MAMSVPEPTPGAGQLSGLLQRHLSERPDEVVLVDGARRIRYAQFDLLCRQTAAWLRRQGIVPGDRVAIWLPNRVEWLSLVFGLARIGATAVACNTRYRAGELEYLLQRSGARLLVMQPGFLGIDFAQVLRGIEPAALPALQRVVLIGGGPAALIGKPTLAFDAFDSAAPEFAGTSGASEAQSDQPDPSDPDALAMLFTTSGTTKGPKLVMHTQRTISFHAGQASRAFGFAEPGAGLLGALPLAGVFGFDSCFAALSAGAPVVLMDTFDAQAAVPLIRRHALTHVFGSDEMFRRLIDTAPSQQPFPSVRVCGFAAFNPGAAELARTCWQRGLPLTGLYGSSEVHALFAKQPEALPMDQRIEGGGRPAAGSDAQVRIRDIDNGRLLAPGQSGEIELRAPGNFIGYLNDPQATAEVVGEDGFFRTGDIGYLREDGTFVYETRKGDAIRLGGYLVSPLEIEDSLKKIPVIQDVQVVGVEIGLQMRCVAFVIARPGTSPTEADVIAAAKPAMAAFKVPSRVWFVEAFPATEGANGTKIQRAKLRQMALQRLQPDRQ